MKVAAKTKANLMKEIDELRAQLKEAEKNPFTVSEAKARSSEVTARLILDQATDMTLVCDGNGKITRANEVAHRYIRGRILARAFDEILKLRFSFSHPLRKEDFSVSEVLGGKIFKKEEVVLQRESESFHFLLSAMPLKDRHGTIHGCVVTLMDITDRKQMEVDLARLASFPQLNPNPVVEVDLAGNVQYLNPAAGRLFPDLEKAGVNHPWLMDLEKIGEALKTESRKTYRREICVGDRWYQQMISSVMEGTRLRIYGFDITERKNAEQERERLRVEAENEKRRLEAVMEALPVGVAITDAQGGKIRANRAFDQVWGGPRPTTASVSDYAAYKAWWVDTGQRVKPEEWASARAVQKKETVVGQLMQIERFDGSQAFVLNSAAPILDASGRVNGSTVAIQDITAHREAEVRYSKILATALSGFWISDCQGRLLEVNDALCRMLGYPREELLTLSIADVEADESVPDVLSHIAALRQKKFDFFVSRHRRKDGSIIDVEVNSTWLDIGEGQLVGFMHDITERKRMEEAVRKSRDELEIRVQERTKEVREQARVLDSFFKFSITPFVILDKDFNFIRVNEAYAKACQREESEFLGRNHFEFYPHEENEAIFRRVVETKVPYQAFAKPFSFPDHPEWETTYWDWTLTPVLDGRGEVEYLVFSLEDVTVRKRADEALKAAHQYNRSLIEASLDPLITVNPEGKVTDVNSAAELATGVPREQLIGSDFSDYFTEPEKAREGYRQVFAKGTVRDYPLAIRHSSGIITDVLYNATLYRNEAGKVQGVFASARDVTELKEAHALTEATNSLLNLFVRRSTRKEYLDSAIELIRPWSGCRCVGIRILNEKDYIPYESYVGFDQEFCESENLLSVKYDQCACIRVVAGNPDPQDRPVMTPAGSFRCENTFEFVGSLSEEEKTRFRGVCIKNGFKSVAIVPIRYRDKIVGAIHIADESEGKVPISRVQFIESIAPLIGEAINRFSLEEQLRDSEKRLRYLSSQLLTAQETERKRIALELHDGIGQMLTAIKFKAENYMQEKEKTSAKDKSLEAIISLVKETIEEVRRMQMDLRPSTLDDLGVLATLGWFCREYQKIYSHIHIEKEIGLQENEVSTPLKVVLYRLTQEAMNNIAKHSQADLVRLSLRKQENKIEWAIEDNGMGFDLEDVLSSEGSKRGLGLSSMRERTELSGGTFLIESTQGKGTTLRASWPF